MQSTLCHVTADGPSSLRSCRMTPNPRGDEMKREVPFICNDGHKSLNGRDQNATRVYHTHALTKCSNACQSNKISSKRGSLSQGQPTLCMYRAPASLLYVVYIIPTKVGLLTRLGPTEWTVNVRQADVCLSGRQKLQNII